MAAIKYGLFFLFLSKHYLVKCASVQDNPASTLQLNTESTGWENQPPGDQGIKDNNFYTIDQNNLPVYNNGMYYYNNYNQQNDINNGRYFSSSQLQSYVPQDNQYEYYQQQMQYVPQNEKYATPQMIQTPSASSNQTPQQMMSDRLDSVDEHQAMVAQYQSLNQNDNYYNQPTNPYQQKNAQLLQNFAAQQQSLQQLQSYPTSLQGGQSHSFPFSTTSEGPLQNQFAMNQPSVEYLDIDQNPNGDNIQENNPTKVFPITQMQYLPQSQTNHEQEFESMTSTSQSQLNLPSQNQQEISPQLLPSSVPSIQSESKTDKLFQDNKAETIVITDSNVTEENMTETVNNLPSQYAQGFQNQNMLPATSNSQSSEPLLPQKQQMSKLQLPTAQSLNRPMQSLSPQLPLISSSTSTPSLSQLFQQPYSQPQNKQELQNQFNMNTYQPTTTELLNVVQNPTTEGLNQPFVKLPTTSSQLPLQVPSTSSSEFQSSLLQSYPPPQNVQIIKFPTNNIKINQPPAGELLSMPDTAAVLNNKNGAFADNSQIDLENKLNNNPSNMMPFDVLQNENIDANTPQLDSINYTASPNNYDDTQKPFEGDGRNSETTLDQVQINPFEKNGMLSNNENENLNPNVHNDKMSSAADVEQIRPDVTYNNGYVNDAAMDLQNPSSNLVSCPLKKYYRRKNKISIPNNNNSGTSVAEMSSDNLLAQNTIAAISNALQVPMYGTKLIFDVTRSNFPNVPIIQQLSFMKSIVQSIVTGLRKAVNSIRNRMTSWRSKLENFNMFNPIFDFFPKSSKSPVHGFPIIGSTMNKDYQSNVNRMQQQILNTGTVANGHGLSRDDFGVDQQTISSQQRFVMEYLGEDIKNAINLNLPMSYSRDSPEFRQFYQQLIAIIATGFKKQIDNVLQGNSLNTNMTPENFNGVPIY